MKQDFDQTEAEKNTTYNHNCTGCEGGFVFFVMAGESPAHAAPCPRNRMAPYAYCVVATAPCRDCDAGIRVATAARKLAKPEAVQTAPNLKGERFRKFCSDYVFLNSRTAHGFARDCNQQRHAQNVAAGLTESGLHDATTGKPVKWSSGDAKSVTGMVDDAFQKMKRSFGL